jgi:hypothetical protein
VYYCVYAIVEGKRQNRAYVVSARICLRSQGIDSRTFFPNSGSDLDSDETFQISRNLGLDIDEIVCLLDSQLCYEAASLLKDDAQLWPRPMCPGTKVLKHCDRQTMRPFDMHSSGDASLGECVPDRCVRPMTRNIATGYLYSYSQKPWSPSRIF